MARASRSRALATLAVAALLAAGCGGAAKKPAGTAAAPIGPPAKPTATDMKIARLVQGTGARLHLDAIRLFGDRALLADAVQLRAVAATRLKLAQQLQSDAGDAKDRLGALAGHATAATQLAAAGAKAFAALGGCARAAAAVFEAALAGRASALDGPDATCTSARLAYGLAKTLADALAPPP